MSQHFEQIAAALKSQQLEFTKLADGTSVLLSIENRKVVTLNTSGTTMIEAMLKAESQDQLLKKLATTINRNEQVDEHQIEQDLAEFLETVSQALE